MRLVLRSGFRFLGDLSSSSISSVVAATVVVSSLSTTQVERVEDDDSDCQNLRYAPPPPPLDAEEATELHEQAEASLCNHNLIINGNCYYYYYSPDGRLRRPRRGALRAQPGYLAVSAYLAEKSWSFYLTHFWKNIFL